MPITYVFGDPTLTRAQALAFGHNARGRSELGKLETLLFNHYPAAFSAYVRRCHNGMISTGTYWIWRESKPALVFLTVRDSSVSATRLRYVQAVCIALARDYLLEGLKSLAIAPLGSRQEWAEIKLILNTWFKNSKLPVIIYDQYLPGVQADENFS